MEVITEGEVVYKRKIATLYWGTIKIVMYNINNVLSHSIFLDVCRNTSSLITKII